MTMNEELINQIVRRILSNPSLQGLLQENERLERDKAFKSKALVLLNYVPDFSRLLTAVQQRWGANYTLNILPSDQAYAAKPELPVGMNWITAQEAMGKSDWQTLILPACSPNTLAKVALGIRDNPLCEMIGRQISEGKSIEIITDYLGLNARTPLAYRQLYEGYIQKVQSYGAKVSSIIEGSNSSFSPVQPILTRPIEHPSVTSDQKRSPYEEGTSTLDKIRFEKKFLGDKQAYGLPEDSKVFVKQGTVISPLARDTLKVRRIELCIEKEGDRG